MKVRALVTLAATTATMLTASRASSPAGLSKSGCSTTPWRERT
jgi:hypothetical protein